MQTTHRTYTCQGNNLFWLAVKVKLVLEVLRTECGKMLSKNKQKPEKQTLRKAKQTNKHTKKQKNPTCIPT